MISVINDSKVYPKDRLGQVLYSLLLLVIISFVQQISNNHNKSILLSHIYRLLVKNINGLLILLILSLFVSVERIKLSRKIFYYFALFVIHQEMLISKDHQLSTYSCGLPSRLRLSVVVDYRARTIWQARAKRHNLSRALTKQSLPAQQAIAMRVYLVIIHADTCSLSDTQKLISPKVLQKLPNKFFDPQGKFHNCLEPLILHEIYC